MIKPSQYGPSSARERTDHFCRQFGLRMPILQAPMASASPPSLAAAVANAGGMGALGALLTSPQAIRESKIFIPDKRAQSGGGGSAGRRRLAASSMKAHRRVYAACHEPTSFKRTESVPAIW